jgi:hypothetical protein
MSWDLNQNQYAEFIRIWQSSETSNEALKRLKQSDVFPATFTPKPTLYGTNRNPQRKEISLSYIQGVAEALRWSPANIDLKTLRVHRGRTACSHLDFDCLRTIADRNLSDE